MRMAKKSDRKRFLSRASQQNSDQSEQMQSQPQHTKSFPQRPKTQRRSSVAKSAEKTLPLLIQSGELSPDVRSAHNNALLELLDPRPKTLPSISQQDFTQQDSTKQGNEGRVLSIQKERELTTSLAFLAGVTGNPHEIMGVCIEELPDIEGCQVMVAINQRLPSDGAETLKKVQRGFEQIFKRLSVLSADSSTQERLHVKETVFNDIIALCRKRILIRLRSKHAEQSYKVWKQNQKFLGIVVADFTKYLSQEKTIQRIPPDIQARHLKRHRLVLKRLLAELDDFETADNPHHESLSRLVASIAQVVDIVPIEKLLESLRDQDMGRQQRTWLLGCFNKIRRYSEIASILCHRARRIPMLRKVRVKTVSSVTHPKSTSVANESTMDIWQSLGRFQYKGETVQMKMFPEWLRRLTQLYSDEYSKNVRNLLKEAKVHAEIQLLVYYEKYQAQCIRPRILAASKKACALCNTLILMHGAYRVPKSHGKLYRGWRLPAEQQKGPLQDDLNVELESLISKTLARLMSLSEKPRVEHDNESSIYSFNLSASTVSVCSDSTISQQHSATVAVVDGDLEPEATSHQLSDGPVSETVPTEESIINGTGAGILEDISKDGSVHASEHTEEQASAPISPNNISTEGSTTSLNRQLADVRLKHGQEIVSNPAEGSAVCFRSRRIELLIDEASSRFSLELLNETEAGEVLRDEAKPVADVRAISSDVDVLLSKCEKGEVYISHGEEVIRICARPG